MSTKISIPFQRLRNGLNMTQEDLAKKLGVSRQAVSKWENGQSYPDIEMLPQIAAVFDTTIDALLNYRAENIRATQYEDLYAQDGYYWGSKVRTIAKEILNLMPPTRPIKILEIGSGEGQAAIFFARNGYSVDAFDIAESGLRKGRRDAERLGLHINFFRANVLDYEIQKNYDIIYSSGTLQYIPPSSRERIMKNIQSHTVIGGLNVLDVWIQKSFTGVAPIQDDKEFLWKTAELFSYYGETWKIEVMRENYFNCNRGGIPHQHCVNAMIARKVVPVLSKNGGGGARFVR